VPHAAATLLGMLHFLFIKEDDRLCAQSRSKLKSAQHTVQHPHQSHAAVHDCITAVLSMGAPTAKGFCIVWLSYSTAHSHDVSVPAAAKQALQAG